MDKAGKPEPPPIAQKVDETRENWIQRIRYSARGYKASFTASLKTVYGKCRFVVNSPSEFGVKQLQDGLNELQAALVPLKSRMQELMASATTEDDFKDYQDDLDSYVTKYNEGVEYVMDAIAGAEKELLPKVRITDPGDKGTAAAAAPDAKDKLIKANSVLKPETLTTENTPQELRVWIEQFQSYHATSGFDRLEVKSQQAYFKQCLDNSLRFRLERKINDRKPIFGALDSCEAVLKEEFLSRYPLFNRRLTFFRSEQASGQSMSDYVIQLRQAFDEADIISLAHEDLLLFKYLCGCTDKELRKELLQIKDPNVKSVEDFILTWEVSKHADKEITKGTTTSKTSQVQRGRNKNRNLKKGPVDYSYLVLTPHETRQSL